MRTVGIWRREIKRKRKRKEITQCKRAEITWQKDKENKL
jgi:hypothetical protein